MMLKVWAFAFAFPFGVLADFSADCAANDGVGDKKSLMYKENCYVAHSTTVDFSVARDSCDDFSHGGQLAFVPTMDAYTAITNAFPGVKYHVGLKHAGTADIKKDWWWTGMNAQKVEALTDFTHWDTGDDEPDSALGSSGYIYSSFPGITDNTDSFGYVCEYARDSCDDFSHGGQLAFIPTMDAYTTITNAFPGVKYHVGLEHAGTADIKKDWWWIGMNGQKVEALPDFTHWDTGDDEPDSALGSSGYIYSSFPGITDNTDSFGYVCEYGRPHQYRFEEVEGGRMPQNSSIIANHTGLIHSLKCAVICSHSLFCHSYAYKENTGECLIVPFGVDDIPNPVFSSDYINFDKVPY